MTTDFGVGPAPAWCEPGTQPVLNGGGPQFQAVFAAPHDQLIGTWTRDFAEAQERFAVRLEADIWIRGGLVAQCIPGSYLP